jgi:hypothetical protein
VTRAVLASVAACGVLLVLQTFQDPVASGNPLDQGLIQFPTPTPTRAVTSTPTRTLAPSTTPTSTSCPASAAVLLTTNRVFQGDSLSARGVGFLPSTTVRLRVINPDGLEIVTQRTTDSNCEVLIQIATSGSDRPGHYRVVAEGTDQSQRSVAPSADYDLLASLTLTVGRTGTPRPSPTPESTATPTPSGPQELRPAPIELTQSLQPVQMDAVPVAGQPFGWRHVMRISNISQAELMIFSVGPLAIPRHLDLLAQGEQVGTTLSTDYSDDVRFISTSATMGQSTVRGTSLVWEGQIGPGQSVEVTALLEQTPAQALVFSNPIRGQSLVAADTRGASLVVPPPAPPQPPPAVRLVQPPPPPVDPANLCHINISEPTKLLSHSDGGVWV